MQITIEISGDKELSAKLRKLGQRLAIFSEAMKDIGDQFVEYYGGEAFASEGSVFGERWKRLSPAYETDKAKRYPGRGILVGTGKMKGLFVYRANNSSVEITNEAKYFPYHQSSAERTKIPRRKMMGINNALKRKVKTTIEADVNRKIRSAGL